MEAGTILPAPEGDLPALCRGGEDRHEYPVIDSHCHLDYPGLGEDLAGVLARAAEQGVGLMVTIGTRVRKFEQVLAIAERFETVFCTVGTHPHNAAEEPDVTVDELVELARHPKVVGIGEAGLDYHYDYSPREAQAASFRVHIAAARETGLPLVIHSREAEDDTATHSGRRDGARAPSSRCSTASPRRRNSPRRGLAIGAYVSFSGILTYKNAEDIRETARRMSRLTGCWSKPMHPILRRCPIAARPNEPAFVVKTLEKLAELSGRDAEAMAAHDHGKLFHLFAKVPRPAWLAAA